MFLIEFPYKNKASGSYWAHPNSAGGDIVSVKKHAHDLLCSSSFDNTDCAIIHEVKSEKIVATILPPAPMPKFYDAKTEDLKAALERRGYTVSVPAHEVDTASTDRVLDSCSQIDGKESDINRAADKVKEN